MAVFIRPRLVLGALLLALLESCSTPPPHPTFPPIRFTAEPPIRLDVAGIDVRDDYQPPLRAPNVDHLFPVPPAQAAEGWAHDRLTATGTSGRGVFILQRAGVVETRLPTQQGLTGAFTTEPAERYDLTLQATVEIVDANGLPVRTATATVTRAQSLLEGITPDQRDQAWYDMTKAAMTDFDRQMTTEIRNNFGVYYDP
jgi:hypothetical protein